MKLFPRQLEAPLEINMTPMIDVVFLLIIFFITVSELSSFQTAAGIELPVASEAVVGLKPANKIAISIDRHGTMQVRDKPYNMRELRHLLRSEAYISRRDGEVTLSVLIYGDRHSPLKTTQQIMRECVKLGVRNLSFSVYPPVEKLPSG